MVEVGLAEGPWSLTDHGRRAEMKLKSNLYDLEAWSVLIREAQTTAMIRARMLYERLVTQYPTSGRYWRLYVEQEMRQRNYEQVEKLFQRCLMSVLNIDLWKCYITYVRQTKASLQTYREKMRQTYEFALDHVGIDFHSGAVWLEFIAFIREENAHGSFAENQKMQLLRSTYHKAVSTPLLGVESIWKEYNQFENTVNKTTAKTNVESVSRAYMNAKRSAQEYENLSRGLNRGGTSIPLRGTPQEVQQLQIWKRLIAWEKSNPTRTEEQAVLVKRVLYAYEQCLLCFGHCADIWYEAALYLQRASEAADGALSVRWADEASIMYERATGGLLKNNLLMHFAHADFEEMRRRHEKAEAVYEKLLERRDIDPTLVYVQYMKFTRRTGGIKVARNVFKKAREDPRSGHHVFVAAALMEYYISKDKNIAFKIFELGLKRYSDEPSYLMAYIDHLSHLNEDNNTRVLFEKAVSSVSSDKASEIWDKFVEFESGVGDLVSLIKVERRRAAAVKNEEARSKDTVMLVDRYKYLDLMPCSDIELKLMGHPAYLKSPSNSSDRSASRQREGGVGGAGQPSSLALELREATIVRPDLKQMTPFKPSTSSGIGMNTVPGGRFPVPSAVSSLLTRLPPPECFHGPFVQLNELMQLLESNKVPDSASMDAGSNEGGKTGKRKRGEGGEESDEETANGVNPPINDIYRARQQKRVHT